MRKDLLLTIVSVLILSGCGVNCTDNSCSTEAPAKEKTLAAYWDFYEAKDPCANGRTCSVEEKKAYAVLGYKASKCMGMTPVDPDTGLTALETPIKYLPKGKPFMCPEGTCSATAPCPVTTFSNGLSTVETTSARAATQTGYLLTAFDTAQGPRFVILKADEEFEPGTTFEQAAGTYESVAKIIAEGEGNIAVFLTAFPLVETDNTLTARLPNDFDVKHIRTIAEKLGKKDKVLFKTWNQNIFYKRVVFIRGTERSVPRLIFPA